MARRQLVGAASAHLTETIAIRLPFESLGPFKTALKRFFSDGPWTADDAEAMSDLVRPHVVSGSWRSRLDDDLTLVHGIENDVYRIRVEGDVDTAATGLWDRVFDEPIHPEPTPHPRKVKFTFGGDHAPGVWHLRSDDPDDDRVRRLLAETDVTDVMVAGNFVTVGLHRTSRWEDRLDEILELVGALFTTAEDTGGGLSRDELVSEGQAVHLDSDELHLLDPTRAEHRIRLEAALADPDARVRRIAVAVLAGADDNNVALEAVRTGYEDDSRVVRRTAIDAAGDAESEMYREILGRALGDSDAWTRWRAVRALADIGIDQSDDAVRRLVTDPDFQVRFEVERVLRLDDRLTD